MKREKRILEIFLFLNKTKFVETKNMENTIQSNQTTKAPSVTLSAVKVFKVGDKVYNTKEEAISAAAMEVLHTEIPKGIDNVIAKAADIIAALRAVGKK